MSRKLLVGGLLTVLTGVAPRDAHAQLNTASYYDPQDGNRCGAAIATIGDVTGDGIDEIVVGMPLFDGRVGVDCGQAAVIDPKNFLVVRYHQGLQAGEEFGAGATTVGDWSGDGVPDYAIGSPGFDTHLAADAGKVEVFSGADGSSLGSHECDIALARLGGALTSAGSDLFGTDRIVCGLGAVHKVRTISSNFGHITYYSLNTFGFGTAVARCGDVNGDGYDDFVVSEPQYDGGTRGTTKIGRVHVMTAIYPASNPLLTVDGDSVYDELGFSVAGCGDLDGDGIRDFMAGALNSSVNGVDCGMVRVMSGADGATLFKVYGDGDNDYLGGAVAGVRDFDGDGVDDFLAGAPNGGSIAYGLVRLYSGVDAHVIWEWEGVSNSTYQSGQFGWSLASGNWNGDALGDFAAGDPLFSIDLPVTGWSQTGAANTYVGCPAWRANYGAGWPGKLGVPSLDTLQDPEVGSPIDVVVGNSLGAATVALMFVGLSQVDLPTSAGGHLLVAPLFSFAFPLAAAGTTLSDVIPYDPALCFLDVDLQVIEVDAFASKKLSFTRGLQLRLGFDLP